MFQNWKEGAIEIDPDRVSILKPAQFLIRAQVQEMCKTKYTIPITNINIHLDEQNNKLIALETGPKEDANYFCEFQSKVKKIKKSNAKKINK